MSTQRVVITGIGPITAIGNGADEFSTGLFNASSGIRTIAQKETRMFKAEMAAEICDFQVSKYLETEKTYLDRSSQFALAAVNLTLRDAGIELASWAGRKPGLILGTAFGSAETMSIFFADFVHKGPRLVKPFLFPHAYANTAISLAAIEFGLDGFHLNFSSGMVSGAYAVLAAYDRIRQGEEELVLAGGYEGLSEALFLGYESQGELSPGNGGLEHCAPFDRNRNGFVLGEGSGVLALESLEHALQRGARIYAEISGAGTAASGIEMARAVAHAMSHALDEANVSPSEVQFVLANANGSIAGDRAEGKAISRVFNGCSQYRIGTIKPMLGETLGASGSLQVVTAVQIIARKYLPPVLNIEQPEDGLELPFVGRKTLTGEVRTVIVNSTDPGGTAVSFLLRAWDNKL